MMSHTACCGLNCLTCEAYQATQADDNEWRSEVAEEWSKKYSVSLNAEDINCDGCQTPNGRKFAYCENQCEIRKCCTGKQLDNCAPCESYPCEKLDAVFQHVPKARQTLDGLR